MGYNRNLSSDELWAVLSKDGLVMWTNGGSSTQPKLMVYSTKNKAMAIMAQSKHLDPDCRVVNVYSADTTLN